MTITTLELIRNLLKKRVRKMDRKSERAKENLDLAYRELKRAEESPDCGQAVVDGAKDIVEMCKAEKKRACEKLSAVRNALSDFEAHGWN